MHEFKKCYCEFLNQYVPSQTTQKISRVRSTLHHSLSKKGGIMKRFSGKNILAALFFVLLVFVAAYLFGCSSVPVTQSTCDDIVSIFSVIGKSVCQTLTSSAPSSAAMMKASGECQQVVIGTDTVDYSYNVNTAGTINITFKSSRGLHGNVQVARSDVLRE